MLSQDLITPSLPFLSLADTVQTALDFMQDYHVSNLPIVDADHYLGIINEEELLDIKNTDQTFADLNLEFFKPAIASHASIYDSVKIMLEFNLNLLPVVNEHNHYLGAVTQQQLFQYLANGAQVADKGAIVELEITQNNYSLSHIARIFESENINILSLQMHTNVQDNNLHLVIKTNKQDLRAVLASLERLNYNIVHVHSLHQNNDDLKSNYDSFMHYLNV